MDYLINFLNSKPLTTSEIILTSVASTLIALILVSIFKTLILKTLKNIFQKFKIYCKKKYKWHKGNLTSREIKELLRKKESGIPLTKREKELIITSTNKMLDAISNIKEIRFPDLSKIIK